MADLCHVLGGPWSPPDAPYVAAPEVQLRDAMISMGIEPPEHIQFDGRIHRFRSGTRGKAGHEKPGWYVMFGDGVPAGRFGCWRAGIDVPWRADMGRRLSAPEEAAHMRRLAEAQAMRDAEVQRQYAAAAHTVEAIWTAAQAAHPEHPYLDRKRIQPHGARVTGDGRLIVPLYDADGCLSSLQYIAADGGKLYHAGGQTGGRFWMVGTMDEPGALYVAEGYATAATIHEATGRPCVVAYSASNLVPVTGTMRELHGAAQDIVIVADHDASGVGQKYADQASAKFGARVVMPPIEGMDANDYVHAGHDLRELLEPTTHASVLDRLQLTWGDELGDEFEAPDELIEGVMTIGSMTVLYGDSNSGKTFFALSLAAAVATGTRCYGRQVDPGLVVYLACEAPGSIRSRLQAIKKYHGCSLANIAIVPVPLNFYTGDHDARDTISAVQEIARVRGLPVRLIIGDTLARMSAGANENSGEDMGPVMARFERVATATRAAMLTIHHSGKDAAKGARGWSGIRAHIDTELEAVEKDGARSVTITKQRELPGKGDVIYFKLAVVEMGVTKFGATATTCVAIPDEQATHDAPARQTDSKSAERWQILGAAWRRGGCEQRDGSPYIVRSVLRQTLESEPYERSPRTALNAADPNRQGGLVNIMLRDGHIQQREHGFIVLDDSQASSLFLTEK